MSIYQMKLKETAQKYKTVKPNGVGEFFPREGYYLVKGFSTQTLPINGSTKLMMQAIWKQEEKDAFLEDAVFEVDFDTFRAPAANGPKEVPLQELVNKVLKVNPIWQEKLTHEGQAIVFNHFQWLILSVQAETVNASQLFCQLFFSGKNSYGNALEQFKNSVPDAIVAFADTPEEGNRHDELDSEEKETNS